MAAYTGAGKCSIAFIKSWPNLENSYASGPLRCAISLRSAPTEKNLLFPANISALPGTPASRIAALRANTQARDNRFIPSAEASRNTRTWPRYSKSKKGEEIKSCFLIQNEGKYVSGGHRRITIRCLRTPLLTQFSPQVLGQAKANYFSPATSPAGSHPLPAKKFLPQNTRRKCNEIPGRARRAKSIVSLPDT